jgi:stage V sporulation protein SpoVS
MKYGKENVRALNDKLRVERIGGIAVMTPGVAALGVEAVNLAVQAIAIFDDFCEDNDPHQEHDFGVIDIEGEKIFFKIDYYDKSKNFRSRDPSDPKVTERVMTLMLSSEY